MEKVHPLSGQLSDRGRLKNRTEVSSGHYINRTDREFGINVAKRIRITLLVKTMPTE